VHVPDIFSSFFMMCFVHVLSCGGLATGEAEHLVCCLYRAASLFDVAASSCVVVVVVGVVVSVGVAAVVVESADLHCRQCKQEILHKYRVLHRRHSGNQHDITSHRRVHVGK
jgi:hypothetical protein